MSSERTSKATATLVLGLLAYFLGAPLLGGIALYLGHTFLSQIRTHDRSSGRGRAITGLVLAYIGLLVYIIPLVI